MFSPDCDINMLPMNLQAYLWKRYASNMQLPLAYATNSLCTAGNMLSKFYKLMRYPGDAIWNECAINLLRSHPVCYQYATIPNNVLLEHYQKATLPLFMLPFDHHATMHY